MGLVGKRGQSFCEARRGQAHQRAQGTTEYLAIVVIVIVIAIAALTLFVTVFETGAQSPNLASIQNKQYWSTQTIALKDAMVDENGDAVFVLTNNTEYSLRMTGYKIDDNEFVISGNGISFKPKEQKAIFFPDIGACPTTTGCSYDKILFYYSPMNQTQKLIAGGDSLVLGKRENVRWNFEGTNNMVCVAQGEVLQTCSAGSALSQYLNDQNKFLIDLNTTGVLRSDTNMICDSTTCYRIGSSGSGGVSKSVWQPTTAGADTNFGGGTTGNYATVGGTNILNGLSALTISMWVYLNGYNDYGGFLYCYSSANNLVGLEENTTALPYAKFDVGIGSSSKSVSSTVTMATGNWYHVVGSWASGGTQNVYLNGVKYSTTASSGLTSCTTAPLIASDASATTKKMNGMVDEVGIWSRQLTDAEIADLYNYGSGRRIDPAITFTSTSTPMSTNLLVLYHMDENISTTLTDSSASGFNGTTSATNWGIGKIATAAGASQTINAVIISDPGTAGEKGTVVITDGS